MYPLFETDTAKGRKWQTNTLTFPFFASCFLSLLQYYPLFKSKLNLCMRIWEEEAKTLPFQNNKRKVSNASESKMIKVYTTILIRILFQKIKMLMSIPHKNKRKQNLFQIRSRAILSVTNDCVISYFPWNYLWRYMKIIFLNIVIIYLK